MYFSHHHYYVTCRFSDSCDISHDAFVTLKAIFCMMNFSSYLTTLMLHLVIICGCTIDGPFFQGRFCRKRDMRQHVMFVVIQYNKTTCKLQWVVTPNEKVEKPGVWLIHPALSFICQRSRKWLPSFSRTFPKNPSNDCTRTELCDSLFKGALKRDSAISCVVKMV